MRIAYPTVIAETEEELAAAERRLRGRSAAARVRLLHPALASASCCRASVCSCVETRA